MKRTTIITALLTACLVGASAQKATPIDHMVTQLGELIYGGIQTSQANHGIGTTVSTQAFIDITDYCAMETCGLGADSLEIVEAVNEKNRKTYDRMLSIIRHGLDSITALPAVEESYHFESHHKGIDTIRYSICLSGGEHQNRYHSPQFGFLYSEHPNAELISFYYTTRPKRCGKHFYGWGELRYSRTEPIPGNKESVKFNWEQYLQAVTPILNQRGITQRKFRWVRDGSIANESEFFVTRTDIGQISTGETSGTLYFIPRNREDLMESVVKDLKAATLDYIHEHPEQYYAYKFNSSFRPVSETDGRNWPNVSQMFRTIRQNDEQHDYSGYVFLGSDIRGYYILLCDVTDAMGLPAEWPILQSVVNGKKTYYKGMKP